MKAFFCQKNLGESFDQVEARLLHEKDWFYYLWNLEFHATKKTRFVIEPPILTG